MRKSKCSEGIAVGIKVASSAYEHFYGRERFTAQPEIINHISPRWTAAKLYLYF